MLAFPSVTGQERRRPELCATVGRGAALAMPGAIADPCAAIGICTRRCRVGVLRAADVAGAGAGHARRERARAIARHHAGDTPAEAAADQATVAVAGRLRREIVGSTTTQVTGRAGADGRRRAIRGTPASLGTARTSCIGAPGARRSRAAHGGGGLRTSHTTTAAAAPSAPSAAGAGRQCRRGEEHEGSDEAHRVLHGHAAVEVRCTQSTPCLIQRNSRRDRVRSRQASACREQS